VPANLEGCVCFVDSFDWFSSHLSS
jgi:hypothetical protein